MYHPIPIVRILIWSCFFVATGDQVDAQKPDDTKTAGQWTEDSIKVGHLDRWFRIYRPATLRVNAPSVLLLHGGTQSMRKIFSPNTGGTQAWLKIADREGVLLIVPNGVNLKTGDTRGDDQNWNDLRPPSSNEEVRADDVQFITQLLDHTAGKYQTDTKRVYVTGASNGGMMTYRLLWEASERFAAAATFLAVLPATLPERKAPSMPVPLLIANGTQDPLVKWEGGRIRGRPTMMMSVLENRDWWVKRNGANPATVKEEILPNTDQSDGCQLVSSLFPAMAGGAPVLFLKIEGGGHALPSRDHALPQTMLVRRLIGPLCRDAEGAEIAWSFLAPFKRPETAPPRP